MRNRYILLGDLALIALGVYCSFALRFDWRFYEYRSEFPYFLAGALTVKPVTFFAFRLYQRFWRYASVNELLAITTAVLSSSLFLMSAVALIIWLSPSTQFSRAVVAIDALVTMAFIGGLRMSVRLLAEARSPVEAETPGSKRVLIIGAGDAGVMVLRELQRNPQLGMTPVGFLDDDRVKLGKQIHGVTVRGRIRDLVDVARAVAVDEVLIAVPKAGGPVLRAIAASCREAGLKSQTIPGVFELLDGRVSVSRLRQVEITDLLRRTPVLGGPDPVHYLAGQRVLVTGAGGSIGSELCRQVAAARPDRLIILGHGENSIFEVHNKLRETFPDVALDVVIADIRDAAGLTQLFQRLHPTVVFHAAAYKHVPLMEGNPSEAISNNVLGTNNMVEASLAVAVERFVMISTDKAVSPSNVMGASKRLAEMIVLRCANRANQSACKFAVVRFGNVLGSRGSVVPLFKRQIELGGPIRVTHPEMTRFFMTIPEAVHLVLQSAGLGAGGELFVLDMGVPVRILDLARDMIALSGFQSEEIPIVFTGVRPGEKLDESLWETGADVQATDCPGVLRVTEPQLFPPERVSVMLGRLEQAARTGDRSVIEEELAYWIPSYAPSVGRLSSLRP